MNYLGHSDRSLKMMGGEYTALEISRQPEVWKETAKLFFDKSNSINSFIKSALKEVDQILFTGAGTSSFIGYSLAGIMFKQSKTSCCVVPTTDIVSFPEYYFNAFHTYLVISFARSGESPESIASLELADRFSKKCFHFIITCNGSGSLANYKSKNPVEVFTLPNEANDRGLAMTSSYTSMLLSGILTGLCHENCDVDVQGELGLSIKLGENILKNEIKAVQTIANKDFKRAVFLGSGSLHGTAMEAALKLQELTNGKVICKADTFLGFRHGPKAVISKDTLVTYFFSNNKYARLYEIDLVNSMNKGTQPLFQLGISDQEVNSNQLNHQIHIFESQSSLRESFQPLSYILPAQLLAFFKSMQLGLKPDMPSSNGSISRVVEGVNIYPFEDHEIIKAN